MPTALSRPSPSEHAAFYAGYVAGMPDGDVIEHLGAQRAELEHLLAGLDDGDARYRYAPGKWSVKEVLGHLADAERIFAYRLLRVARGDATPLAGFDENAYVPAGGFDDRPLVSLVAELGAIRGATLALLHGLPPGVGEHRGEANGQPVTVRALAWILAGHERHHLGILRDRYLPGLTG